MSAYRDRAETGFGNGSRARPGVPRTDAKGLAKPCGARAMAAAKHVDASPSASEGGYSPMTWAW